jgi:hypothetical protein
MSMKMIKSKSSASKGSGDSNDNVNDLIHRREICGGTVTHDGRDIHVPVPTNSYSLNSRVQSSSLRTTSTYDWQSGTFRREPMDLLDSAKHNINTMKIRTVTSGRNEPEDKNMNLYGVPCSQGVIRAPKSKIRKSGRKGKK